MLTLDKVEVSLGHRRWRFSISLDTHGIYALLGKSGSGKTTLLNLIGGFLTPVSGSILWNTQLIDKLQPAERPVTTLFQQNNLFHHLSVWKNIALGISPNLKLTDTDRERVSSVLVEVGLSGYDNKRPGQLSGGEQQRVALARCLLRRKPVLLLDEPFSALDATTRKEMLVLLRTVIASFHPCVIMITHDANDASAMNADILDMRDTEVVRRD